MLEGQPFTLPGLPNALNPPGRLAQFMRSVEAFSLDRDEIEEAVDLFIARLDALDGDADLEETGDDEPDGTDAGDQAWVEWSSRGRRKHDSHGAESLARNQRGFNLHEDDEDDDPVEDDDPAEDDDSDRCLAGDDHMVPGPVFARDQWERWAQRGHEVGDEADDEAKQPPAYHLDQTRPLLVTAANDQVSA